MVPTSGSRAHPEVDGLPDSIVLLAVVFTPGPVGPFSRKPVYHSRSRWHPSLTSVGPCLATWWDFFRDNFRVADHPDGTSLDALMEGSTSGTMSCAVRRARPIVSDVAGKPSSESSTAGGLV